jgi:uncharacterized protein (TIGR03083 family)
VTNEEMFDAVMAQRLVLIGRLEGLDAGQWDTASLCAGWRVRDVVGHLVSILDLPLRRFLLGVVKARGFDRFADRAAREYGDREPAALTARYRELAPKRFSPPVVGPIAPLVDVYVHTRDIERPLGLSSSLDADGLRTVLDFVCGGKARGFIPARRTAGLGFAATDLDWAVGDGLLVEGPAEALMLAVNDRSVALADLSGPGAAEFRARMEPR